MNTGSYNYIFWCLIRPGLSWLQEEGLTFVTYFLLWFSESSFKAWPGIQGTVFRNNLSVQVRIGGSEESG